MHTVQAAAKVGSRGPDSPASATRRKPTGLFTRAPTALCHCHSTSNLHLAAALTRPSAPWSLPPGASATRWTTCATAKAGPVSLKAEDICLPPAMGGHRTNERPSPWPTVTAQRSHRRVVLHPQGRCSHPWHQQRRKCRYCGSARCAGPSAI